MTTSSAASGHGRIVPAHLNFLAIYSPDLGTNERTERDQIVFFYESKSHGKGERDVEEQLRQIGLAQGIVNFARYTPHSDIKDAEFDLT